jgi:aspartyl-tRNA(Asn)/glutamyl-tRNA(Gln) amidotransferase subunit A
VTDLTALSLLEASSALRAGAVSSLDLTRACLDRIASLDSSLHAFLIVSPSQAEAQAAAPIAGLRAPTGEPASASGILIAVRDVLAVSASGDGGSRILRASVHPTPPPLSNG